MCRIFNILMFYCVCFHSITKEKSWNVEKRKIWIKILKVAMLIYGFFFCLMER